MKINRRDFDISLHPIAQNEYEESVRWYLKNSHNTALKFIKEVENTINLIKLHPLRWKNEFENYFELGLKKFPFTIIYIIDSDKELIIILAIYHQKRTPQRKYRKPHSEK
jgi:hypothetical protein